MCPGSIFLLTFVENIRGVRMSEESEPETILILLQAYLLKKNDTKHRDNEVKQELLALHIHHKVCA